MKTIVRLEKGSFPMIYVLDKESANALLSNEHYREATEEDLRPNPWLAHMTKASDHPIILVLMVPIEEVSDQEKVMS